MQHNKFNADEKILHHMGKVNIFFNKDKTLIVCELDLTNKCNHNCPACTGVKENAAELSFEQISNIVKDLSYLECKGVILSGGGEPLIHPSFIDTLKILANNGIEIGLNTNGLALDKNKAIAILQYCKYCRISLDAGTAEMHTKTHGTNEKSFKKTVNNIKILTNLRDELNSETSLSAGFLTSESTKPDMENFVALCKQCNLDFAQFRPFTGDYTDITEKYLSLKKKYESDTFKVLASLHKYKHFNENIRKTYDKCYGMFFSTVITADNKIFACLHHRQKEKYKIADLNELSLENAWQSYKKYKVFEEIDVNTCPNFCRNDAFNRVLYDLSKDTAHKNFL